MYSLIVKGSFSAAHLLPGHPTCGVLHGHTWKVEVKLSCEKLKNDMVVDFAKVKQTWRQFDHTYLNNVFNMPTAENIADYIFQELVVLTSNSINGYVDYVRIWESDDACCEVS